MRSANKLNLDNQAEKANLFQGNKGNGPITTSF